MLNITADSERLSYVGQNFGGCGTFCPKPTYQYLLGVHEHGSKKLRLYNTQVFTFKPSFKDDLDQRPDIPDLPLDKDLTFREKNDRLLSSFGSSKKRRMVSLKLRSKVDSDIVQSTIGQVAGEAVDSGVLEKVDTATAEDQYAIIPPCNKEAEAVTQVYSLAHIISDTDMAALATPAEVFTQADSDTLIQWETDKTYCSTILRHLHILPLADAPRLHKSSCLLYLHYMITLFNKRAKDIGNKDAFPADWPPSCKKSLQTLFTEEVGSLGKTKRLCMPSRKRDKLAAYILTLCLILDEYTLPLTDIGSTLKLSRPKITQIMQLLGCRMKKEKKGNVTRDVAHLQLPLVFPQARQTPRKLKK